MKLVFTNSRKTTIFAAAVLVVAMNAFAFAASGTWSSTGSMHSARDGHTATLLVSGKVLVAGGTNNGVALTSAELYNLASGTWASTGSMHVARTLARAVLLSNGSVLVMGGCVNDCLSATSNSAEVYNPTAGTFTATGSMLQARAEFGVTLLANGQVLVAGGCTAYDANGCLSTTNKAEIYNPATGTWKATSAMRAARHAMTATRLPSGKVLVAGGATSANDALISSEIYDPVARTWTLGAKMVTARSDYASIMLTTGKVLFAGGENINGVSINNAELYNPSSGTFTATGKMTATREEHTVVLLANGNVLVSGGNKLTLTTQTPLASAELYNPTTGTWTATGSMSHARSGHTSTVLTNGHILNAGGSDAVNELSGAELYTP
ncbi:MAG TPA: kelch repeat-containing protein [Candidatus Sulfotelmatobacter sp.]|jgi:N-acetylneuraminic acid mutarotase|nr:kelch repeat-containing protein [Candidatus Sulfotelmatobacter sp.]